LIRTSRALFSGNLPPASCWQKAIAAGSKSASTTESNKSVFDSSRAASGLPLTIMFKARSAPTKRGKRCVPPAPGKIPSFTSGNPSCAVAVARR
jgi:hypothetical protein